MTHFKWVIYNDLIIGEAEKDICREHGPDWVLVDEAVWFEEEYGRPCVKLVSGKLFEYRAKIEVLSISYFDIKF